MRHLAHERKCIPETECERVAPERPSAPTTPALAITCAQTARVRFPHCVPAATLMMGDILPSSNTGPNSSSTSLSNASNNSFGASFNALSNIQPAVFNGSSFGASNDCAAMPISFYELLDLQNIGVNVANIGFTTVTMESDKFICIREKLGDGANQVVIVDLEDTQNPIRRPITADSALMHPSKKIIALKASKQLQIFNIETKSKIKSHLMSDDVLYWRWISANSLALVTENAVYHWSIDLNAANPATPTEASAASGAPIKIFERHASLAASQIISYKINSEGKWMILVGIHAVQKKIVGCMQLYSKERNISQIIEGHCGSFAEIQLDGCSSPTRLFCFATRSQNGAAKMHIVEIDHKDENVPFSKKSVEMIFPVEAVNDFPVSMQIMKKFNFIFILTKYGFLHIYDIESACLVFMSRISPDPVFVSIANDASTGILAINRKGQVFSVLLNPNAIVPYILSTVKNVPLALDVASRCNLSGAEELFVSKFNEMMQSGNYNDAARIAASSPGSILRTPNTIENLKTAPTTPGQIAPILQYFSTLLEKGALNKHESIELARPVLAQNKKQLLEKWLKEEKIECSEELGDIVRPFDSTIALSVYLRSNSPVKVVECFADLGQYSNIVIYSKKIGFQPDYASLLKSVLRNDPDKGVDFARAIYSEKFLALESIFDCFSQMGLVQQVTAFILDILKQDLPEYAELQTKLLELQLATKPNVADAILENKLFKQYNKPFIAKLCESAGLYQRALENYQDVYDIKRLLIAGINQFDPEWVVKYFSTLSVSQSLECLRELLTHSQRQTTGLCVKIACAYSDVIGPGNLIELFENMKSFDVLYSYLSSVIKTSTDSEVHFKYIQSACKTGQFKEIEKIVKESNFYDPEKVKNFLKEAKLPDQLPLIIVCDRFNFINDLVTYLYQNNLQNFVEVYVQKVNSERLPEVVGALIDIDADETSIIALIASVKGPYSVEALTKELENRNKLEILKGWLEFRTAKVSDDPYRPAPDKAAFNALAKIYIDTGNPSIENWLNENNSYDTLIVGKYCEKRNPYMAYLCFEKGHHDKELIELTNANSMFKHQARYLVKRRDPAIWNSVLAPTNEHRRSLIDQVIAVALPETQDPEEVSVAVKCFMEAELPNELIELLEKIVLENTTMFSENRNLQNLIILTAIKASPDRVGSYITKLSNYDAPEIAKIAISNGLYEEAFIIYSKYGSHSQAISVLLDCIHDNERAFEYAEKIDTSDVWSKYALAQLNEGYIKASIESFMRADDYSQYKEVISAAEIAECFSDLTKYLSMARKKSRVPLIEEEYLFCLAKSDRIHELEDAISTPSIAQFPAVADRCYENALYQAAKILYNATNNYSKLATTFMRLNEYQMAVDCARKANNIRVWKEVCESCIKNQEYRLGQICSLNLILNADELEQVCLMYEKLGLFDQLIALLENGVTLERAHMGVFTELSIAYAKYKEEKLADHLKKYYSKINLPKIIRCVENNCLWNELMHCHVYYEEYDLAANVMMKHPVECFDHEFFKVIILKVTNLEIYYKALRFYMDEHPLLLNDLLSAMGPRADFSRVVQIFQKFGHLPLIKQTLFNNPQLSNAVVNNALIELLIEEENIDQLTEIIERTDAFDQISVAARLEKHEILDFRRLGAYLYRKNRKFKQAISLAKKDSYLTDAIESAAESKDTDVCEDLVWFFAENNMKAMFCTTYYLCYEFVRPDVVMEIGWRKQWMELIIPFMCQVMRDLSSKVAFLEKEALVKQTQSLASPHMNSMHIKERESASFDLGTTQQPIAALNTVANAQTIVGVAPNSGATGPVFIAASNSSTSAMQQFF